NRRLYLLAIGVFVSGSLLCGIAWSITSLIGFRLIQALGMGLIMPLTRVILFQAFPRDKRGLAVGVTALGFSFGPMLGPVVSGYLLEYASWRAIFYVNIPVGLLSLGLAYVILPVSKPQARQPFDIVGCVTMAIFLITFLLAVTQGRKVGWDTPSILMLLATSLVAALVFVAVELHSSHPFVELRLYKNVTFAMASIVNFLNTLGFMATNFLVALFLQQHLGYTPLQTAWMLMPSAVLVGTMSVVTGRLSDLVPPKFLVIVGLGLVAGCLLQFSSITTWTSVGLLTFWLTARGFARAFIMAPLNAASMAALHESEMRMGAGLRGFGRGLASASSVALAATWFQGRLDTHARLLAQDQSIAAFGRDELLQSLTLTFERLGDGGQVASRKALAMLYNVIHTEAALYSYHETFALIGGLAIVAILPALWMGKHVQPHTRQEARATSPALMTPSNG
ncbi:MAG: DHA2 family efflux MFS transporter permease subunit, partial [Candidatus Tectomicrobia bacterium]|nr:DHA2 family efflux MFS transporter permease subunit [Candidatus Tectomicrobia bacterium]